MTEDDVSNGEGEASAPPPVDDAPVDAATVAAISAEVQRQVDYAVERFIASRPVLSPEMGNAVKVIEEFTRRLIAESEDRMRAEMLAAVADMETRLRLDGQIRADRARLVPPSLDAQF